MSKQSTLEEQKLSLHKTMVKSFWLNWINLTVEYPKINARMLPHAVYVDEDSGKYKLRKWASMLLHTFNIIIDVIDDEEFPDEEKMTIAEAVSKIDHAGEIIRTHHFMVIALDNGDLVIRFRKNSLKKKFERLATE